MVMNKTFLTLAAVATLGLAACGEEASENNTNILSDIETTTDMMVSETQEAFENAAETAEEFAAEAQTEAEQTYQTAVEEVLNEEAAIEPAAGDVEGEVETEETQN
jgi:type IV pilus biogenesis protein CpaD/CtpE